ncbi:hypothetical protein GCM10007390_50010 [Persicitalea jodogahamensis]|uniref:Uncharacterized protein n=2 Tax=Persicitalea jodogahamensis TaxID=402147 RepID=A0A8J3D8M7_9BACT|nr:hypothetical protein GCM10007390_50010 [Persicitalea jodogahamensis]
MLQTQRVQLEPITNQISALPNDPKLEYYFIPVNFMKEYKAYHREGKTPFKNLKLVNYGKPAISLSFFSKHKYTVKKENEPEKILLHLKNHREELLEQSLFKQLDSEQSRHLKQVDELFRTLRENPDAYQTCFSNYHHYYRYWYCTFRYFEDKTETKAETDSAHLLKHTERIKGQVHERLNVIFIDPDHITRPVPYDNKRVDRELDTYPIKIKQGTTTLYLRKA